MAFSVTTICNRALQILGAKAINMITENTVNARECNKCYDSLREALLSSHPWNFATYFASLPAVASPPNPPPSSWPQTTTFNLPNDFLKLVAVNIVDNTGWLYDGVRFFQNTDYLLQDGTIITWVQAPLDIRYVRKYTDPNTMHPLFREALSALMAQEMCETLTQSNTKAATAQGKFKLAVSEARRINALDKPPVESPEDTYLTVRH